MAVGKNKRLTKSSKKGSKKKAIDVFKNKHKYEVRAPSYFQKRNVGNTICTKTMGTRIASDSLKGRVFNVCLADLKEDEEQAHRIVRLRVEDVQDRRVLTNFYGIQLTTDKLRSMVKKWQTLIEANVDAKTTDGYTLRVFCLGFTKEVNSDDLKGVVNKLIPDSIASDIAKACQGIYPLHDVHIRKVKVLKRPRFDLTKLLDMHGEGSGKTVVTTNPETGEVVERAEGYEPPTQ